MDNRTKVFNVTLEVEALTYAGVVNFLGRVINDDRTLSFSIQQQEESTEEDNK